MFPAHSRGQSHPDRIAIVREGDTLAKIILRTYGKLTPNLIALVQAANPGISNPAQIDVGQRIVLPTPPN